MPNSSASAALQTIARILTLQEENPFKIRAYERVAQALEGHGEEIEAIYARGGVKALREVLLNTPAVANIIRENRMQEMRSVMQTGSETGMISFDKDLKRLLKEGKISQETYDAYEGI